MKLFLYLQNLRKEIHFNKYDLVYIYIFGGLLGAVYEEIFYLIARGETINASGSVFLPINVVYGGGVLLVTLCFYKVSNWLLIWLFSSLLCGAVEFIMSYLSELIFHAVSWDYSSLNMSIDGRTTIPYMVLWGLAGMFIVVLVIPFLLQIIHKIPMKLHHILAIIFMIIVVVDWSFSFYAALRYTQRQQGIYYDNFIAEWFDKTFDDEFMSERFPNLIVKDE